MLFQLWYQLWYTRESAEVVYLGALSFPRYY